MTTEVLPGSFRDPSGFVFRRDGLLLRQVNQVFAPHYDQLMVSGLYAALVDDGLLVPHEEVGLDLAAAPGAHRVLRPEVLPFVSNPYEWCFGQLRDAALLTLEAQRRALRFGMSMRDASAYNVQFRGARPVLVDTLSFEALPEGRPWVAYRQFCQHFLAPLALMAHRDVRLGQLSRVHIDGVPLDLAVALLPRRARLRPGLLVHLALHSRSQARHAARPEEAAARTRPLTPRGFEGLLDSLEEAARGLRWEPRSTVWSAYYGETDSYAPEALEHKKEVVGAYLDRVRPRTVWDLGGNTGLFARLAVARGAEVVCLDADPGAVELNYRQAARDRESRLLPLVCDLTNPSPAIGWANGERLSLLDRGPADMALALALVHHLAIGNNVPLARVAGFLRQVCTWLVVEFVPKTDAKVRLLLAAREDVFPEYTREGFESAFGSAFAIEETVDLASSERAIYLMRAR